MDRLTISAASGMRARMESLEMLANNLANTSTSGYKADREFYSLYLAPEALDPAAGDTPTTLPVVERQWTDFSQGVLTPTGNPLDLALAGKGLFAVNGPSGTLYTRNGSFKLSSQGVLETQEGYPVRGVGGGSIQIDPARSVEISSDGRVRQDGQELGQLEIISEASSAAVQKQGANYFQLTLSGSAPSSAASVQVYQGKLETSNVGTAESAVRLVSIMRQFEMLQRAATLASDMDRHVVDDVARIGS
jgi:flagellar basal-body rod protein FlgF